jgi:2-dehydro-3-deoxy-D-gluconate 5-dehydrogenase
MVHTTNNLVMDTMELFSLNGKTALVTGCDKGIGYAMANALADAGANIIGTYNTGSTQKIKKAVKEKGGKFTAYKVDFSNREEIYGLIKKVKDDNHHADILVNNAGTIIRMPAAEHTDESWDKVLSINLDAPFILAREFGRQMIKKGEGKIIFTCSLLSFQGGINVPGYTASKSALGGLVKALANEWAGKGICVNGIAPGYIATDNTEPLIKDKERNKAILSRIPAGRWGLPGDIEGPVVFLASKASAYVNGTILTVDGGWMAR